MVPGPHIRIILLMILTGTLMQNCYKESIIEESEAWNIAGRVLEFDGIFAFCDKEEHLLLYSLPSDTLSSFSPKVRFGDYQSIEFDGRKLIENEQNDLGEVRINHPYSLSARKGNHQEKFQLYFTNLPLLHIHTEARIQDEPKRLCRAELAYTQHKDGGSETHLYSGYAGIEIRGRTSAAHEKKSYGLELWENWHGDDLSAPLLGMREGEDWILDAMYVDKLRMRNKISFEIWELMWKSKGHKPFLTSNPGIQCEFIELFINQRYMGLFCLSERLDENLINLNDDQTTSDGVLYKAIDWTGGSTAFTTYNSEPGNSMIWEGWEQIYPDDLYRWEPLAELRKTVVLDPDEVFEEGIDTLLHLDAAAEYYLFINLILAHDNIIKNYFLTRYPDESSFLILPWDLEGSWGIMWDGDHSSSNGLLENRLFDRLMELDVEDFNDMLKQKWQQYRASLFQQDSLSAPAIRNADLLKRSGAIERENIRWPGMEINMDQELEHFCQWTALRLEYLDQVFD